MKFFNKVTDLIVNKIITQFKINRFGLWIILFVFFVLVNLTVVVFSLYLYLQINEGLAFVVDNNSDNSTHFVEIDKLKLSKTIHNFDDKTKRFIKLEKSKLSNIIDPSL